MNQGLPDKPAPRPAGGDSPWNGVPELAPKPAGEWRDATWPGAVCGDKEWVGPGDPPKPPKLFEPPWPPVPKPAAPALEWESYDLEGESGFRASVGVFTLLAVPGRVRVYWAVQYTSEVEPIADGDDLTLLAAQLAAEQAARDAGVAVPPSASQNRALNRITLLYDLNRYDGHLHTLRSAVEIAREALGMEPLPPPPSETEGGS